MKDKRIAVSLLIKEEEKKDISQELFKLIDSKFCEFFNVNSDGKAKRKFMKSSESSSIKNNLDAHKHNEAKQFVKINLRKNNDTSKESKLKEPSSTLAHNKNGICSKLI